MRILFTGGGTGGHFYPIIGVVEGIWEEVRKRNLISPQLYYMSTDPYDEEMLYRNNVEFRKITAGKMRRYFSLLNFFDILKTGLGIIQAFWQVFFIFPDVIFCKGGYPSFPVVLAGKFFRIPVFVHESDTVPGRVNKWAGKFAKRVALSFPEASEYFPEDKVAYTGNPIRQEIKVPAKEGAYEFLELDREVPVVLVLGGSQGAQKINNALLDTLADLVQEYQIIHQTGEEKFEEVKGIAELKLENSDYGARYKIFGHLNDLALRMSAGAADMIISRAGSAIFEIAVWGVPSILIPISISGGDHQRKNAFTYARSGAAQVIEESNLKPSILKSEISIIMNDEEKYKQMIKGAKEFARPDAGEKIAKELINVAIEHE